MMSKRKDKTLWVAVRVQRGFVSDVRAYDSERSARRMERSWRRQMNLDYDETSVSNVHLIVQQGRRERHAN